MKRRVQEFFDGIWDRLFAAFIILFAFALLAIICVCEILFKKSIQRAMDKFFEPTGDDDIVSGYRKFRDRHPFLAWLLKWPLLLFGL